MLNLRKDNNIYVNITILTQKFSSYVTTDLGIYLMMQQNKPDDYVLATGTNYSVRQFVHAAFAKIELEIKWSGSGLDEVGTDQNGIVRIKIGQNYFRPAEVDTLLGDATKAGLSVFAVFEKLVFALNSRIL